MQFKKTGIGAPVHIQESHVTGQNYVNKCILLSRRWDTLLATATGTVYKVA